MTAFLTLVAHHKHGTIIAGFKPKLTAYVGIHLLGATELYQLSRQSLHCKMFVNLHSGSTSGRNCVEANMTPNPWLYREVQNNPLQHGAPGLGILSATLLQWTGVFPINSYISKCWTHRHQSVKAQGALCVSWGNSQGSTIPVFGIWGHSGAERGRDEQHGRERARAVTHTQGVTYDSLQVHKQKLVKKHS